MQICTWASLFKVGNTCTYPSSVVRTTPFRERGRCVGGLHGRTHSTVSWASSSMPSLVGDWEGSRLKVRKQQLVSWCLLSLDQTQGILCREDWVELVWSVSYVHITYVLYLSILYNILWLLVSQHLHVHVQCSWHEISVMMSACPSYKQGTSVWTEKHAF